MINLCDKANFKNMFLKYHPDLERYMKSRGANAAEALDIAQESFLRLWEKCKEVTEKSLKSFLFTTSDRILVDQYRKQKTKQKYLVHLGWKSEQEDGQYQLEMDEFKTQLERVISSMKPLAREVFMLSRYEKMKYKEIASRLNISQKAVEKRMQDALLHLAKNKIPKFK